MGNYFSSSETKESINIINDIDDLNVIVSGSEEVKVKHENENEIKLNDFLNEQKQTKTDSNLLHLDLADVTDVTDLTDVTEQQTQLSVSDLLECAYKRKNMKKKKCKKNKKHLH